MKSNRQIIVAGKRFSVPPRVQRVPGGWQVRYAGSQFFADGKAGARVSFRAAVAELQSRYTERPAVLASKVRRAPLSHKTSDLPAGVSGPVLIRKAGRADSAEFKVSLPRRGKANASTSVYIASETTWSLERYQAALAKAMQLRETALRVFMAASPATQSQVSA